MLLVRKITLAKWEGEGIPAGGIPADEVTVDMRTSSNSLSLWRCEIGAEEEAALAMAAASGRIDIAWFPDEGLQAQGLVLENTDGNAPVVDLVKQHVDAKRLDYSRLGQLAILVHNAIATGNFKRLPNR